MRTTGAADEGDEDGHMSMLLHLLVTAAALWVTTRLVGGVTVDSMSSLLLAALALGVVNAVVRPILQFAAMPLTLLTLGLFYFVVNGAVFGLAAAVVPGFRVASFLSAVLGAIVVGVVSWVLHLILPNGTQATKKG